MREKGKRPFKKREDGDSDKRRPSGKRPSGNFSKPRVGKGKKRPVEAEEKRPPRLNQYIARAGVCSRREADELIATGKVKVNGRVVREMGLRVHREDKVEYEGKVLRGETLRYVLLNKPKGFIANVTDEKGRKTVMDLVKNACDERLYPVGRLERDTTGLLLFTNDGDLARKLTNSATKVKQIYHVYLDKAMKEEDIETLMQGIELDGDTVKPDVVNYVQEVEDGTQLGAQFHSGRNTFVRGMFEHFGYKVEKLDRVLYGNLTKKDIQRGKWRFLKDKEVAMLKVMVGKSKKKG
jgi:23S rRNA pseudouridine2605 synthase